eukprot:scaffold63104_cov56-Phaeocystis_antarctica.AAC.1
MDYKYLRWQVIDTPGVLDRPIEARYTHPPTLTLTPTLTPTLTERNTVEMQSITALAHLQCAVLYVLDISEQCGFDLKQQQMSLFEGIPDPEPHPNPHPKPNPSH